jgi:class 3 adenylate cyclase
MTEERRLVTVLFADVTGSTAMGEALDPEDLRALLARFYGIAREVVASHGGTLEKFVGDAVMAVFGLPTAHGDDPARAIAAGLELRDRVRQTPDLGDRLPIRVALNTGEVVASANAESGGDFLLTGDAVNVAARLVQWADPWRVVAGERTVKAAPEFAYGEMESVEAKGKSVTVHAGEVVGRLADKPASAAFFGRDEDLAQLELLARRSLGERRPYLVTIVAPAGTGKTRLLEAFEEQLATTMPDALTVTAQCLPYGQRLTFWPLRGILFGLFGLSDQMSNDMLSRLVVERLMALGVTDADATGARLLATIGSSDVDTDDRAAVFSAWRELFERFAAEHPLVIVFEDLHWSSDVFLELVEYVTQPRGEMPLLMLALTRPELLDRRPNWGGGRRNHLSIELAPLDDAAIEQLVTALLGSAPPDVARAVASRAEGNPFFAGELVRSITDRLGPDPDEDAAQAVMASLPDNVQATVLARLDGLPHVERRCLQLGSVFGRTFSAEGVVALDSQTPAGVEQAVSVLLDRDMIRWSPGEGYRFRHILIREVAYGTLTRAERARLHARAGEWLEAQARGREEALAELVAYHYREAATLASLLPPDVAETVRAKAVEWLRRAADTALRAAAQLEAYAHLTKAMEWATPDQLPDLHERAGDCMFNGEVGLKEFTTAYRLARQQDRPANDLTRKLGKLLEVETRWTGSVGTHVTVDEMAAFEMDARELIPRTSDPAALAIIHLAMVGVPTWVARTVGNQPSQSDLDQGDVDAKLALDYARQSDDAELISSALDVIGGNAQEVGDWQLVKETSYERLALGNRLGILERIDATSMLVWSATVRGELVEADEASQALLASIQPGQAASWALHLLGWRAMVQNELGKWDEVLTLVRRMRELWEALGRPPAGYSQRGFLAALDVSKARRDEAEVAQWSEICINLLTRDSGVGDVSEMRRLGPAYVTGDIPTIVQLLPHVGLRRADFVNRIMGTLNDRLVPLDRQLIEKTLSTAIRTHTQLIEAEAHRTIGLADGNVDELRQATKIAEACDAVVKAARLHHELGALAGDESLAERGLTELERIGDVDQLERYLVRRQTTRSD